jgi:hypothetical protein
VFHVTGAHAGLQGPLLTDNAALLRLVAYEADLRQSGLSGGQSGYSSLRQARNSSTAVLGVRFSRNEWYGATNGSGAVTV